MEGEETRTMKTRALAFLLLATAAPAWAASDEYRDGRIRLAEPGVTLQRVDEAGAEEALSNMPFLPGDRVWTDFSGRAEFQFADGSVARLDTRSKLDYLAHEDGREGDLVALSLWSGSLILHVRDGRERAGFQVETPEGLVEVREGGMYRVDVERGELRLSVYEGEAVLDSGRGDVSVRRGERAFTRRGRTPSEPEPFDEREDDAFARWDREQGDPWAWGGDSRRYLPEEVASYAADFDSHGSWHVEIGIGYVWRPRVAVGWAPYVDGRWVWTAWGWTWVPYERWGWAPFHYGRWGHSPGLGWYWIPGATWGPAWVSWAVGGRYVGWCPLGYRDRPVFVHGRHRGRGGFEYHGANAWVFAHRDRLGARDVAVRRADLAGDAARELRPVDVGHNRLTRELRVVDAGSAAAPRGAVPRNIRVRPSPADTVPELRGGDGRTTIPDPAVRRGGTTVRDRWRYERDAAPGATDEESPRARPRDAQRPRAQPAPSGREDGATERTGRPLTFDRQTTSERGDTARTRPVRPPEIAPPASGREQRDTDRGAVRRERREGDDSEVLRRFFQPLTERRERSRDDDGAARVQPRDRGEDRGSWQPRETERRRPSEDRPTWQPRSDDSPRTRPRERGEERTAPQAREPERRRPSEDRPAWQPRDDGAGRRAPERSQPQVERRSPRSGDGGGRSGGGREGGATRRQPPPKDRDR
jgi:hypothetical protein